MIKRLLAVLFSFFYVFASFAEDMDASENEKDYSHRLIWLPIVYYTPETKLAVGALVLKNFTKVGEGRTSHLLSTISVTQNAQSMVNLSQKIYLDNKSLSELSGGLGYRYFPNKYYGRVAANSLSEPENYIEQSYDLNLNYGWNFLSRYLLRLGVSEDFKKIDHLDSGSLIEQDTQSVSPDIEVTGLNISAEWDERDYPQAPKAGYWYRLVQTWYGPRDRVQGKILEPFMKSDLDLRSYWACFDNSTFAVQLLISTETGAQIPFQYLNTVGGGSRLRGFYAGQFRDKSLTVLQTEYRQQFRDRWAWTASFSWGRLASDLSQISSARDLFTGDLGLHYFLDPENRTKIRLDLGFAQKPGVYLLIGEAF